MKSQIFLSHPVISGVITAFGSVITASQLKHILGVEASGYNLLEIVTSLVTILAGAGLSVGLFLCRTSRPHSD